MKVHLLVFLPPDSSDSASLTVIHSKTEHLVVALGFRQARDDNWSMDDCSGAAAWSCDAGSCFATT